MSTELIENATIPMEVSTDTPLHYKSLVKEGIKWVEQVGHEKWTNYNSSDPGRSILDMLCYSLLDLGYKGEFPIEDILSDKSNSIPTENYLYTPREALFANPLLLNDFRKLLIDKAEGLKNIWIEPVKVKGGLKGVLLPHYELNDKLKIAWLKNLKNQLDPAAKKLLWEDLFALKSGIKAVLLTYRNLGDLFLDPVMLKPELYSITGDIYIPSSMEVEKGLAGVLFECNNLISAYVKYSTYDELKEEGLSVGQIMEGPKLDNGFIKDDYLQPRLKSLDKNIFQSTVLNSEYASRMASFDIIPETMSDVKSSKKPLNSKSSLEVKRGTIPFINYSEIAQRLAHRNDFHLFHGGQEIVRIDQTKVNAYYAELSDRNAVSNYHFKNHLGPEVPEGQYRDIKGYHSIQKLFPQQFGLDVTHSYDGIPEEKRGSAKQLKGYVMLFEQLIADYQAQLSNFPNLLSFDSGVKAGEPICKTHFTQGLYKTPGSRFILKAFEGYERSNQYLSEHPDRTWEQFQKDPNNTYEQFLQNHSNKLKENIDQKSKIMAHLLARYGEKHDKRPVLTLNEDYGNYSLEKVETISGLLKRFDIYSGNMGRSYFHIPALDQGQGGMYSGLEVRLGLILQLNEYYEGLEELLKCLLQGKDQKKLHTKIDGETKNYKVSYRGELILDMPFLEDDLEATLKRYINFLQRLRTQTMGMILIDNQLIISQLQNQAWSILCNGKRKQFKSKSGKIRENFNLNTVHRILGTFKESCELEVSLGKMDKEGDIEKSNPISSNEAFQGQVSVFFPDWICRLKKGSPFDKILTDQIQQEGPMHLSYRIYHIDAQKMESLMDYRKTWLEGLHREQRGESYGRGASKANDLLLDFILNLTMEAK